MHLPFHRLPVPPALSLSLPEHLGERGVLVGVQPRRSSSSREGNSRHWHSHAVRLALPRTSSARGPANPISK